MQVCILLQTDNHTSTPQLSFLQAGCPSCCPTNSVKAVKDIGFINSKVKMLHCAVLCRVVYRQTRRPSSFFGSSTDRSTLLSARVCCSAKVAPRAWERSLRSFHYCQKLHLADEVFSAGCHRNKAGTSMFCVNICPTVV